MDFESIRVVNKSDLPQPNKEKYLPLFRKLSTISKDEVVTIPIKSSSDVARIKRALKAEFKFNKYKACQRTVKGQMYCYIELKT